MHHNRSTLDARCAWAFLCGEAMLGALRHCSLAAATAMRSRFQDANLLGSGNKQNSHRRQTFVVQ
ncbi:hypothetical protein [Nostoc sp. 'Peltigera membranacea cyanobiont' N6]|uniref:hypothetical protein n=1 Tax=Nostoc sp. 'Peltigera membranacea cyanobiont' N6 TaxID=1261031 RepID=UPI0015E43681|nr:hypothetical protein [Nostoc sp. 'Peltigera membranacea cyanobiont' N6]